MKRNHAVRRAFTVRVCCGHTVPPFPPAMVKNRIQRKSDCHDTGEDGGAMTARHKPPATTAASARWRAGCADDLALRRTGSRRLLSFSPPSWRLMESMPGPYVSVVPNPTQLLPPWRVGRRVGMTLMLIDARTTMPAERTGLFLEAARGNGASEVGAPRRTGR